MIGSWISLLFSAGVRGRRAEAKGNLKHKALAVGHHLFRDRLADRGFAKGLLLTDDLSLLILVIALRFLLEGVWLSFGIALEISAR